MAMSNLTSIYDEAFFEEWGPGNEALVKSARIIAEELHLQLQPQSLLDLGCGCGIHAHRFQQLGVKVMGVDGIQPPAHLMCPIPFTIADLTDPMPESLGRFDITLCLDVGEHIPESLRDDFLANLCRFSDLVLLGCASPGQGGLHHVNEQPKRYWIKHMKRFGFAYNRPRTGKLCERFKVLRPPMMWMWEHISVYERMPKAND